MSELNNFNPQVMQEFRANQGKVGGQLANMPLLLLTTTGAKSGRMITKPLVYTRDGDRIVIIASFAGGPKHPPWYHNLVNRQAEQMPIFAEYQQKTTRQIPVFVLTRID